MPYIQPGKVRDELERVAIDVAETIGSSVGNLNYLICRIYCALRPQSYAEKSRWHAAICDAADEIQRKDINPYEDGKAGANGDLPWPGSGK